MPLPVRVQRESRQDPRYQRVIAKLTDAAKKVKRHPPAKKKADEPAPAAKGPANEKSAGARAKHVAKLEQAQTPKPETKTFLETLQAEIAKAMPKTLGETEDFMKGGTSEQMKGSLKGNVAAEKNSSTRDIKSTSAAQPSETGVVPKPVTPIAAEPGTPSPLVNGGEAMPAPKPDAEISLQASKTEVQGQLDQERLSDQRLQKANDPRFSAVVEGRDAVVKQSDAGPARYRAKEAGVLGAAVAKALDVAKRGAVVMLGVKGGSKAKVLSRQEQQRAKEELELKTFSDFVVSTFERAKQAVDKRLEQLDTKVNDLFDKGVESALADMKGYVNDRLGAYKADRYSGFFGGARWLKDKLFDLPDEVNKFYEAGRVRFTRTMNALAVTVANVVESELAAAKKEVRDAQALIATRSAALSPAVKARGAKLQAEFTDKFAELESGIEDKKQQIAEGLAQKYKEAFGKADEAIKAIQEENKGLVTRVKEKIAAIIKAIREFKERLMGILRKGANAIGLILDDPIGFLKNLLSAIKQGFSQFVDNIWAHLKAGFITWLFGSLSDLGIEIPTEFSLGSILKLVLGVLGITYAKMRQKAVKLIGPTAVTVIEKVVEYVQALMRGGAAALWDLVKEDLSNLKEMVVDAIQDWLITTIVKKAVAKILTLFNPVGAIIAAIMLIVDVVKFVIEKANQILDFVEAVVSSLYDIATGAIGTAANWIEKALARMVPLLIGFLAELLGIGGITDKIKQVIKKVQDRVDKAIDKAIAKVVVIVRKVVGAVKAGAKRLLNWWKKKVDVSGGGEKHTLTFEGTEKGAHLVLRSTPEKPSVFLTGAADSRSITASKRTAPIKTAETHEQAIEGVQKKLAKFDENDAAAVTGKKADDADTLMTDLDTKLGVLGGHIGTTLTGWGVKDQPLKAFSLPRSSFTIEHKRSIAAQHAARGPTEAKELRKNVDDELVNLKKGLARRHVVSSHDMASHYPAVLANKKWSEVKLLLEQRGSISAARTPVTGDLGQASLEEAAKKRYGNFFGYAKNLFIGDSKENSSIQQHLDDGHPDMADKELRAHVRHIKRAWAIDDSFKETDVK